MKRRPYSMFSKLAAASALSLALVACGDSATPAPQRELVPDPAPAPPAPEPAPGDPADPACDESFDSTFAAIQTVIFENRGCTQDVCHGDAASGGLDLRSDVAYDNLLDVPATGSELPRLVPGSANRSYLYLKLLAATGGPLPGNASISGSPMPVGVAPLSEAELEAVRKWIEVGASETGTAGDNIDGTSDSIGELLGACLPDATPISVVPLEPPAPDEGIQLEMPPYVLEAASEVEVCFASYYDVSDLIPEHHLTPDGEAFYINESEIRQDPHSHHFVPTHSGLGPEWLDDPSFGAWTCRNGERQGEACDPIDLSSCGDGMCASEVRDSIGCIGFGPPAAAVNIFVGTIGGPNREGYFAERPVRGIMYWNSHAFNLTTEPHELRTRVNLHYTDDRRFRGRLATDTSHIFQAAGQPPFTIQEHCATHTAPEGAIMFRLSSHTHKRGGRFWVTLPSGEQIYENFVYSDPVLQDYDPPIVFDSPDPAERTMRYCAIYNNGVGPGGEPDPRLATKLSSMPDRTSCTPVACTAGRIGEPCAGADDDAACDSSPGAGDGDCDACPITGGVTTENEMFMLVPYYGEAVDP